MNIKNNDYMLTSDKTSSNNSSENITKYSSFGSRKKYLVKNKEKKKKIIFQIKNIKKQNLFIVLIIKIIF